MSLILLNTFCLINWQSEPIEYNFADKYPDYEKRNPQLKDKIDYLGIGVIHSVEGILQVGEQEHHFWAWKIE